MIAGTQRGFVRGPSGTLPAQALTASQRCQRLTSTCTAAVKRVGGPGEPPAWVLTGRNAVPKTPDHTFQQRQRLGPHAHFAVRSGGLRRNLV